MYLFSFIISRVLSVVFIFLKKFAVMLAPRSMRFKYTFIRIKKQQQHQKEVEKGG